LQHKVPVLSHGCDNTKNYTKFFYVDKDKINILNKKLIIYISIAATAINQMDTIAATL